MYVTVSFSQNELNAYKYIIVPKKYDFMKGEEDKYQLNSLTEFLFKKHGFKAVFQDETFPQDLLSNPCLGVIAYVTDDSKLFTTRLKFEMKDCYNKTVYTSIEGVTREKEFKKANHEALRAAFVSFETMDYEFNPALVTNLSVASNKIEPVSPVTAASEPTSNTKTNTDNLSEPVPVVVVEENKVSDKNVASSVEESKPNEVAPKKAEPVAEVKPAPIPVPVMTENQVKSEDSGSADSGLKSYKNENISFFIIEQGGKLMAYVNETKNGAYKKGELIGTFIKTSIPDVYRVTWKDKEGKSRETTGYFDEAGNLKIDVNRNGEIEIVIFEVEE